MGEQEGYRATIEWGFWKFIKYLIVPVIFAWFFSWIATRFINLDLLVWNWLVMVHTVYPWLVFPETAIALGSFYIIIEQRRTWLQCFKLEGIFRHSIGRDKQIKSQDDQFNEREPITEWSRNERRF